MTITFTMEKLNNAKNANKITDKEFNKAIEIALTGNSDDLKNILTIEYYSQINNHIKKRDYHILLKILETNNIEIFDSVLDFVDKQDNDFIHHIQRHFLSSISSRCLVMVMHVLKQPSLSHIKFNTQELVNKACSNALGIVKHIVENYEVNDMQQPFINSSYNLCVMKHIVKYASEKNQEITEETYTTVIKECCNQKATNIVKYLIDENNAKYSPSIKEYLYMVEKDQHKAQFKQQVISMFELRDLHRNLNTNLVEKEEKRKLKI